MQKEEEKEIIFFEAAQEAYEKSHLSMTCADPYHDEHITLEKKPLRYLAVLQCPICGRKLCSNCRNQGFSCMGGCDRYGCRHCQVGDTYKCIECRE